MKASSDEVYDKSTQGTCGFNSVAIYIGLAVLPPKSANFYENSNL